MTSLEVRLRLENSEFREQLGGAMETAKLLGDRVRSVRDRLAEYVRGRSYPEQELMEILQDLDRLCGRRRQENQTPIT